MILGLLLAHGPPGTPAKTKRRITKKSAPFTLGVTKNAPCTLGVTKNAPLILRLTKNAPFILGMTKNARPHL